MSPPRVLQQQIPLARSILWAPTSSPRPADVNFPVFLRQSALQAIYEHLATPPPSGQGIVGFLLGDRCECPVTGVSYTVIDAALRLNQTIYSDRTRDVVTRLWKRLEAQLEAQRAHLLGWYHTHAPLPLELSVHDVETHQQYFSEPWQVGVVVGTDTTTPAGAFFRAGDDDNWVRTPQPFYELLNEDSVRPDGKKRSFMTWKTYRAYNPPALQPRAATSAPVPPEVKRAPVRPEPAPPAPPKAAPRVPPPPVEEPEEQTVEGLENMPQAELDDPARTELEETPRATPPAPPRAPPAEEEEEWEDPGELKFLSAAEDIAAAPSSAPPPRPVPSPAPVASAPSDWGDEFREEPELEDEQAPEELETIAPPPPKPRAVRRRVSLGGRRMWRRIIKVGLLGLLVAAGWVGYQRFGPTLLQRLKAFIPSRQTRTTVKPRAAAPRPPAPSAAKPTQPTPTPPPPPPVRRTLSARPEFALLDQAGDSLERALRAYDRRMHLFETRRLDCPGLGRGLVRVERAVARYSAQRGATRTTLDPERVARDRELRSGIDAAGRTFQRSQCERQ